MHELYSSLCGVASLEEAKNRLAYRYEPGINMEEFVRRVLKESARLVEQDGYNFDDEKSMIDREVAEETGLPGTKIVVGDRTFYIHGIPHPQGGVISTIVSRKMPFIEYLRKWAIDRHKPMEGRGVIFEDKMRNTLGISKNAGYQTNEIDLVLDIYGMSLMANFRNAVEARLEYFISTCKSNPGAVVDTLKGRMDPLALRALYRQSYPEPFITLAYDAIYPERYTIERSCGIYWMGRDWAEGRGLRESHFVVGLSHEAHIETMFNLDSAGYQIPEMEVYSKFRFSRAKRKVIEYLATHQ